MGVKRLKTALVTGASSALGQYITHFLNAQGYRIIGHYHNTGPDLTNPLNSIINLDFSEIHSLEQNLTRFLNDLETDPIDLLINNAALFHHDSPTNFSTSILESTLAVNSMAPAVITQYLYNHQAANFLAINILDYATFSVPLDFFSYNLSKKLLAEVTLMQAAAYADKARVNGIALGPVIKGKRQSQTHFDTIASRNLFATPVNVHDILNTIAFLIDTSSITGQIIALDNGKHLYVDKYS